MPGVMRSAMAGGIGMNVKIYLEHPNARGDQVGNGRGDWDEGGSHSLLSHQHQHEQHLENRHSAHFVLFCS